MYSFFLKHEKQKQKMPPEATESMNLMFPLLEKKGQNVGQFCVSPDYVLLDSSIDTEEFKHEVNAAINEMFGEDRLALFLADHRHLSPREILSQVEQEIYRFTGTDTLQDDGTALLLKFQGAQEPMTSSSDSGAQAPMT